MKAETFIQWKNTDVCMDFWCDCGHQMHIDGYFAYVVLCNNCKSMWEMPNDINVKKIPTDFSRNYVTEKDEDNFEGLLNL